jgi:DNA-binding protein HU-beta
VFARHKSFIEVIRRLLALSNVSGWERRHPCLRFASILLASAWARGFGKSLTVVGAALYHPHASADSISLPNKYRSIANTGGSRFVIKLDIINRLADQTGIPKLKAEQAVDALFHSMKEALSRGDRIELRGFGVFIVKPRKRGVGRNPRTGEEVAIPSGKTIRFKPGKELQAHDDDGATME